MAITILSPRPPPQPEQPADTSMLNASDSDSDDSNSGGVDLQGDVTMRAAKRRRPSLDDEGLEDILTPGSIITTDTQWMR
jgi:exosome complex component RRP4